MVECLFRMLVQDRINNDSRRRFQAMVLQLSNHLNFSGLLGIIFFRTAICLTNPNFRMSVMPR